MVFYRSKAAILTTGHCFHILFGGRELNSGFKSIHGFASGIAGAFTDGGGFITDLNILPIKRILTTDIFILPKRHHGLVVIIAILMNRLERLGLNGFAQIAGIVGSFGLVSQYSVNLNGRMSDFHIFNAAIIYQSTVTRNTYGTNCGTLGIGKILHRIIVIYGLVMLPGYKRTEEMDFVIQTLSGNETVNAVPNPGVVREGGKLNIGTLDAGGGDKLSPFCAFGILRVGKEGVILVIGESEAPEHVLRHDKIHLCRANTAVGPDAGCAIHTVIVKIIPDLFQQRFFLRFVFAGIKGLVNGIVNGIGPYFLRRSKTHRSAKATGTTHGASGTRTVGRTGGTLRISRQGIIVDFCHICFIGAYRIPFHDDSSNNMDAGFSIGCFKMMLSHTSGHIR